MSTSAENVDVSKGKKESTPPSKEPTQIKKETVPSNTSSAAVSALLDLSGKVIVKAQLNDDIRRVPIQNEDITLDELVLMMQRVFKGQLKPEDDIVIKYKDEDNDLITIQDSSDLSFAIACFPVLKLKIIVINKTVLAEKSTSNKDINGLRQAVLDLRQQLDDILSFLDSYTPPSEWQSQVSVSALADKGTSFEQKNDEGFNESSSSQTARRNVGYALDPNAKEFDPLQDAGKSDSFSNLTKQAQAQIQQNEVFGDISGLPNDNSGRGGKNNASSQRVLNPLGMSVDDHLLRMPLGSSQPQMQPPAPQLQRPPPPPRVQGPPQPQMPQAGPPMPQASMPQTGPTPASIHLTGPSLPAMHPPGATQPMQPPGPSQTAIHQPQLQMFPSAGQPYHPVSSSPLTYSSYNNTTYGMPASVQSTSAFPVYPGAYGRGTGLAPGISAPQPMTGAPSFQSGTPYGNTSVNVNQQMQMLPQSQQPPLATGQDQAAYGGGPGGVQGGPPPPPTGMEYVGMRPPASSSAGQGANPYSRSTHSSY